ncbi:MAG: ROK family glucokinase [Lachnospira sp.]|nr:ROK family glucokinase [Lachnospira sp.]
MAAQYVFGVDLGGTTVKMGLFNVSGEVLDKWEITTRKENNGELILSDIAASIKEKIAQKEIALEDIIGVGMGVPGPVKDDGTVIKCANLGWGIFNVAEELGALVGLPVKVGNDANVAALGEMWQGGAKGHDDVVMVTLGTGVGGGIIVNGKMIAGNHGAGGEIGHMKVDDEETDVCGCGKTGCLEQYSSATGIVRIAKKVLAASDTASKLRDKEEITAKDIFDSAKEGDAVALTCVDTLGSYLGNALANVACVADPEVFVVGGGVSRAGDILLDTIRKHYVENAFHACKGAEFVVATLGNDAGIYGSAKLILG